MGKIQVDERSMFIMKQSSLKSASTYLVGRDVKPEYVLEVADLFLDWVLEEKPKDI